MRILAALENHGGAPFLLSSDNGSKVSLGYTAFHRSSQVFYGFVPGNEEFLNRNGLAGRQLVALDLEKKYLASGSNFSLIFDQQMTGGHSLVSGSYCYQEQVFPTLMLRTDATLNLTISPFVCDDEF